MSTFISYSRANSDFAVRIAKDLKSAGYDVWFDQLNIPTGSRWDDEIEKALHSCSTFLLILSPEAMQSQNVKDEIGYAIDSGKHILPVMIKQCDVPFRLRRFQFVNFTTKPYPNSLAEIKDLLSNTSKLATAADVLTPAAGLKVEAVQKKAQVSDQSSKPKNTGLYIGIGVVALLAIAFFTFKVLGNNTANETPTEQPTLVVDLPTEESIVTEAPTETDTPVDTPAATEPPIATEAGPAQYFLLDFNANTDLTDWDSYVTCDGNQNSVSTSQTDTGMVFNLKDPPICVYYYYKPVIYRDVVARLLIQNLGSNGYEASLFCRKSPTEKYSGYEYWIVGGGFQGYFAGNPFNDFTWWPSKGSLAVKSGQVVNEIEMTCVDDEISFQINGQEVSSDTNSDFFEGVVGFSIRSHDVSSIDVKVLEFEVSEP